MNEGHLQTALNSITDGVIAFDGQGAVKLFNSAAQRMFGYPESEVLGKDIGLLIPSLHAGRNGETVREVQGLRKDSAAFRVDLTACQTAEKDEPVYMFIARDMTERQQAEQRLIYFAQYDALTGLPTRALFQDRANHALRARSATKNWRRSYIWISITSNRSTTAWDITPATSC